MFKRAMMWFFLRWMILFFNLSLEIEYCAKETEKMHNEMNENRKKKMGDNPCHHQFIWL